MVAKADVSTYTGRTARGDKIFVHPEEVNEC